MHPSPSIAELRSQIVAASAALLRRLQTDEASLYVPIDGGGRLVVEILAFSPSVASESILRLLPKFESDVEKSS